MPSQSVHAPSFRPRPMDVDTDLIRKVLADHFDNTTLAGDPRFSGLIATILKNYFGFQDNSKLCAHTYCEVDYFQKDPVDVGVRRLKS